MGRRQRRTTCDILNRLPAGETKSTWLFFYMFLMDNLSFKEYFFVDKLDSLGAR
jgi:hypothetical protein